MTDQVESTTTVTPEEDVNNTKEIPTVTIQYGDMLRLVVCWKTLVGEGCGDRVFEVVKYSNEVSKRISNLEEQTQNTMKDEAATKLLDSLKNGTLGHSEFHLSTIDTEDLQEDSTITIRLDDIPALVNTWWPVMTEKEREIFKDGMDRMKEELDTALRKNKDSAKIETRKRLWECLSKPDMSNKRIDWESLMNDEEDGDGDKLKKSEEEEEYDPYKQPTQIM